MIWSGGGLLAFFLSVGIVGVIFGIDPDESSIKFFLVLAPVLFVFGIIFDNISYNLHTKWTKQINRKGFLYNLNKVFAFLKCDLSHRPTVFFIPLHLLSIVSIIISLIIWSGIFS